MTGSSAISSTSRTRTCTICACILQCRDLMMSGFWKLSEQRSFLPIVLWSAERSVRSFPGGHAWAQRSHCFPAGTQQCPHFHTGARQCSVCTILNMPVCCQNKIECRLGLLRCLYEILSSRQWRIVDRPITGTEVYTYCILTSPPFPILLFLSFLSLLYPFPTFPLVFHILWRYRLTGVKTEFNVA